MFYPSGYYLSSAHQLSTYDERPEAKNIIRALGAVGGSIVWAAVSPETSENLKIVNDNVMRYLLV